MEKKQNASKLISSLVALSLATTLGVPTIALAETDGNGDGGASTSAVEPTTPDEGGADGNAGSAASEAVATELPAPDSEGVIKLSNDVTLAKVYEVSSKITVDLNGYSIRTSLTGREGRIFAVRNNGDLTIKGEGTIDAPNSAIDIYGDRTPDHSSAAIAKATIESGTLTANEGAIGVWGKGAELTVNGGTIIGRDNGAIMGNGTKNAKEDDGGYKITINGGAITGNTTSEGYRNCGIYHPNSGDLIINGGTITGTTGAGVVVRSGNLKVTGGTISGKGQGGDNLKMGNAVPTYCGGIEIGYSVKYPGGMGDISVTGGTISSEKADAFKVIGEKTSGSNIAVTGGTFSDPGVYQYATSGTVNVNLTKDCTGDVTIPAGVTSTLDLNGKVFSGGTVAGKATLTNYGTTTIKDSVSGGKICREDDGASGYYTIDNQGTMTIESGSVYNKTGKMPKGSSLIRNAGLSNQATLNIIGGSIKQDGFIAVKNDDHGILNISGGTIEATGEYTENNVTYTPSAVQNWSTANINAGTVNGAVWTSVWSDDLPNAVTTISETAEINGAIINKRADGYSPTTTPRTNIAGGTHNITRWVAENNTENKWVSITGGTFSSDPTNYLASGYSYYNDGDGNYVVYYPTPAPAPTTETTTVANPDGSTTTTVTDKKTGESTATTKGTDGTTIVEKTDAAGTTTTEVTIPAEAVDAAAGAPVEVPAAIEVAEGQAVSISAPAGTTVSVPLDSANAGDVVVIVNADGTETPVPLSLVEDGKAIVKLDGNQTIKIVNNAKDFEDVADDHWAADDIDFASSREIFLGIGNGSTYEPETALTRNMMMTVLARVDGADTENSDPWYAKGQAWAVENGVSNGLWGEDSITREQLVTMLFNYANKAGLDTTARADMSSFPDATGVSPWATDAVSWAVAEGILKGVDNTYVAPQGLATRAQAAAFLARYVHAALL